MTDAVKSVLHAVQEDAGAAFMEDGGWTWTTTFGDAEAEYLAVRENAGMWDVFGLQKWDVTVGRFQAFELLVEEVSIDGMCGVY